MAWSIVGTFLSTVIYVEAAPTALARIQWKYYIIFIVLTALNILILYLWCPEVSPLLISPKTDSSKRLTVPAPQTKGLSLEEINGKFGDEVVVPFTTTTEKQRASLEAAVLDEKRIGSGRLEGAAERGTPELTN